MRHPFVLSALLVASGCVHVPPLTAVRPEQAVPGDPRGGSDEVGKVRLTVHPDDWRGWPYDLDDYATPVEVFVENGSEKEVAIRYSSFSLLVEDGFRYDALAPGEVRHLIGAGYGGPGGFYYYGTFGVYPWPGLFLPWRPYYYPYVWWGDPAWGDPGYAPPPPRPGPVPSPSGTLAPGGKVSVLVFFPVAADRLAACTLEARILSSDGTPIGTLQIPFERRPSGKAGGPPR